jgi:hypothetical protein
MIANGVRSQVLPFPTLPRRLTQKVPAEKSKICRLCLLQRTQWNVRDSDRTVLDPSFRQAFAKQRCFIRAVTGPLCLLRRMDIRILAILAVIALYFGVIRADEIDVGRLSSAPHILRPLNTPISGVARLKGLARAVDGHLRRKRNMKRLIIPLMARVQPDNARRSVFQTNALNMNDYSL